MESVTPEDLSSKIAELAAARDAQQEQQQLRASVLTSALQSFQRVFLDNGLNARMRSIAETARQYLSPDVQSGELDDITVVQADGGSASLSGAALTFLRATDKHVLLIRCRDTTVASQTSQLLLALQWRYFEAHERMVPLLIDLADVPTAVDDPVGKELMKRGYCAAAVDALHRENPGMLVIFSNWTAEKHCTNIHARAELNKWSSASGSAPKVIFVVTEAELAGGHCTTPQPVLGGKDEALTNENNSSSPLLWDHHGPGGAGVFYFMPSNALGQPLPTALEAIKATASSKQKPLEFVGHGAAICEAECPRLDTVGSASDSESGGASIKHDVDVQHVIARCQRAILLVRWLDSPRQCVKRT